MNEIIINATASRSSGALSILKDFINYLVEIDENSENRYHLFTCIDDFDHISNLNKIIIHKVNIISWISRIAWDEGGLKSYCRQHNFTPDLIISMQNTCTKYPNVKQLVYYHQPLPLIKYRWNLFNKKEFILFLYTHFYSFFVKRNSKNSYYVVQLPYIKKMLLRKFPKLSADNVRIIRPNKVNINTKSIAETLFPNKQFMFFYHATPLSYKNHIVLINAVNILKQERPETLKKIKILFSVSTLDKKQMKFIYDNDLSDTFIFNGVVPYNQMLSYYKSVQALLFPSKIETFGLPLIEAASFGLPIVAADLSYAREVLEEYNNMTFINPDDPRKWANVIMNFSNLKKSNYLIQNNNNNTWTSFINYANLLIKKRG